MATTTKTAAAKPVAKTTAKPSTATQDAAGRRVAKKGEAPLARYLEAPITIVQAGFTEWLRKQTGYAEIDERSVALATALRHEFQRSEDNQSRLAARRAEIEKEQQEREARRQEKAAKAAEPKPAKEKAAPAAAAKAVKETVKTAAKSTAKAVAPKTVTKASPKAAAKATVAEKPANRRRPKPVAAGADSDF